MNPLPFRAPLRDYQQQAQALIDGWRTRDRAALEIIRRNHPRFLDEKITWLPKNITDEEATRVPIDLEDARLALARWYTFADWSRLAEHVTAVTTDASRVSVFESSVEAVVNGDAALLSTQLGEHRELVRARSARVTQHDPPVHAATLLHYIAANGVEGHRQKSPKNAVEIATLLLKAGADPDALAHMYGGEATTLSMLVSSTPPAEAGVQIPLVHTLIDFGASLDDRGSGDWTSPLMTALAFGFTDTARALVKRGVRVGSLAAAAGLGRFGDAERLLPSADAFDRHRALALAAQHGHADIVGLLLDAGEDPNRFNPKGNHAHSTPLHQAALAGHGSVVRLLVEHGARLDIHDRIYQGTPLGWANYAGQKDIAGFLEAQGAKDD
jgi:ankyrin repeat protein